MTRRRTLRVAVALGLLGCSKREPARHDLSPARTATAVTTQAPARAAAFTEALSLATGVADFSPRGNVLVHAPEGFEGSAPLHLVVLLHGLGQSAYSWAGGGLVDPATGRRVVGWSGGNDRHDLAETNTLFVVPQLDDRPGHSRNGRWRVAGGFRRFVDELLGRALGPRLGGPRSLRDVASITMVATSAGGASLADLLRHDDLDGRVRSVVLFDAIYGDVSVFTAWARRATPDAPRRLVYLHPGTPDALHHAATLAHDLAGRPGVRLATDAHGALTALVRAHDVLLLRVPCGHFGMLGAYVDKVLRGLDLPARPNREDPKTPVDGMPLSFPPLTEPVTAGAIDDRDRAMRDGSRFDGYDATLAAGERLTLDLRGGPTRGYLCPRLDVDLRVLEGDHLVARNDDDGLALGSALTLRAPRAGRYRVLVTTHGPWLNTGSYMLRVRRESVL